MLLFDQNISHRIVNQLSDTFPGAKQVRSIGLENTSDKQIWEFALKNGLIIVTFDSDFYDFSTIYGHPPKIIWMRSGNKTTKNITALLKSKKINIIEFIEDDSDESVSCLQIIE